MERSLYWMYGINEDANNLRTEIMTRSDICWIFSDIKQ
jgi:hypothetical protein